MTPVSLVKFHITVPVRSEAQVDIALAALHFWHTTATWLSAPSPFLCEQWPVSCDRTDVDGIGAVGPRVFFRSCSASMSSDGRSLFATAFPFISQIKLSATPILNCRSGIYAVRRIPLASASRLYSNHACTSIRSKKWKRRR